METRILVHLHFQETHGELRAAGFGEAGGLLGPHHTVEPMAQPLDFISFKGVEPIAGCCLVEAQCVGGALENAVLPAVGVHWLRPVRGFVDSRLRWPADS